MTESHMRKDLIGISIATLLTPSACSSRSSQNLDAGVSTTSEGYAAAYGYGNALTDFEGFKEGDVETIYWIGPEAGADQTTAIESYTKELPAVEALTVICTR